MTMIYTPSTTTSTTTNPTTTVDQSESFWTAVLEGAPGASLSVDRCIDWLLDLHQATPHQQLKDLVSDVLDDLRAVGMDGRGFAELDLDDVVLGALASVETAFEICG